MADTTNKVSMELPGVDFAALARQVIAVEVSKVLSVPEASLNAMVIAALQQKVGDDGKPSNYNHNRTYVEWAAMNAIRGAVLSLLNARVEAMKPKLAELIEASLKRSAKAISITLSDDFVKAASRQGTYGFKLDITMQASER